jgi:hypothetical protein
MTRDVQPFDGVVERPRVRLSRRQRGRGNEEVDLLGEAELPEFESLVFLIAVGEDRHHQSRKTCAAKRRDRVIEDGPARFVALEITREDGGRTTPRAGLMVARRKTFTASSSSRPAGGSPSSGEVVGRHLHP